MRSIEPLWDTVNENLLLDACFPVLLLQSVSGAGTSHGSDRRNHQAFGSLRRNRAAFLHVPGFSGVHPHRCHFSDGRRALQPKWYVGIDYLPFSTSWPVAATTSAHSFRKDCPLCSKDLHLSDPSVEPVRDLTLRPGIAIAGSTPRAWRDTCTISPRPGSGPTTLRQRH